MSSSTITRMRTIQKGCLWRSTPSGCRRMQFDHEKLDVYHIEIQFIAWVTPLIADVRAQFGKLVTEACDHLDRASLSALFNTAEGNGKRQRQTRAKFFDDARG